MGVGLLIKFSIPEYQCPLLGSPSDIMQLLRMRSTVVTVVRKKNGTFPNLVVCLFYLPTGAQLQYLYINISNIN